MAHTPPRHKKLIIRWRALLADSVCATAYIRDRNGFFFLFFLNYTAHIIFETSLRGGFLAALFSSPCVHYNALLYINIYRDVNIVSNSPPATGLDRDTKFLELTVFFVHGVGEAVVLGGTRAYIETIFFGLSNPVRTVPF